MTIPEYIDKLNTRYKTGISTEHSYRGELQNLVESLAPEVMVTNEPTRVACGSPDYIITKGRIPVGYIEAKDIGKSLDSKEYKEQFDRYRTSLTNLIITDYLEFRLYLDGLYVSSVTIGEIQGNKILARSEYFEPFSDIIKNFCTHVGQIIKSASKLSKMMAGKARLMANVIEKALTMEKNDMVLNEQLNLNLHNQYESFKQYLIHDITKKGFADIYSQTIAYGMFAARLNDLSLPDFSRQEAAELIPKSNPFLRNLFQYIAGYNLDDRIKWIVDELADVFRATNVAELLQDFGKSTGQNDPIIHFYETFLAEYDPKLRKSRGVYYTPEPVVNFIVRAVDDILKSEFGLQQGLADTSKIRIKVPVQGKMVEQEVHKVQILDPAAGTGTFLAGVIKQIHKQFEGQQGVWSNYVEEHLIPRLNGFEILMASYAMAHLKLDLLLKETGFTATKNQRLKVYLTNSLEEHHPDTGTLFANWLSTEANEANHVKRDNPVMVVLGNPPYSVSSSNKSEWIENLTADYKKDLHEKNIQPLSDDYIKFIRFGQYFIEKKGEGILAYISNNSFIDGITHRQMRKHLLETFDKIYILDLHGNSKKLETAPNGDKDENVFDIMQGVSINILLKTNKKKRIGFGEIFNSEFWGKRENKYSNLLSESSVSIKWQKLEPKAPYYFFINKKFADDSLYKKGIPLTEIFKLYNTGIETGRDDFFIDWDKATLTEKINSAFENKNDGQNLQKYRINNTTSFRFKDNFMNSEFDENHINKILYRPFDIRYTYYDPNLQRRASFNTIKHLLKDNLAITSCRQQSSYDFQHILVSNCITERCTVSLQTKETGYVFPLYLYPPTNSPTLDSTRERIPNLQIDTMQLFSLAIGIQFSYEKDESTDTFSPIDLLDYIYAVLHSPAYREKYKEFLKIDFPRIPYPKDQITFWQLVKLGGELRKIHLLESPVVEKYITTYPVSGTNVVDKVRFENQQVWINSEQYLDNVPQVAWEFYIGGYQPAQKWLKDRKGRVLSYDDIMHYQKIIVALNETDRIMKEIDTIQFIG
jgi:predicted helicase